MADTEAVLAFTGSLVALVTPFNADGTADHAALAELIAWHEDRGTAGLFLFGVAGEGGTIDDAEFAEITKTALDARRSLPVFVGCTGDHTAHAIRRVRVAGDLNADGAILTVPANMGPDQAQAAQYFLDAADASTIPIGTFNNPARLLTDLDTPTMLRILDHPRIVLHKEGSSLTGRIAELLAAEPAVCFLADDSPDQDILVPALALGARGIANASGNLLPDELAALAAPWTDGSDLAAFRERYFQVVPLIKFLYSFRSPIGTKSMMNAAGLPAGHLRRPLTPLSDEQLRPGLALVRDLAATRSGA